MRLLKLLTKLFVVSSSHLAFCYPAFWVSMLSFMMFIPSATPRSLSFLESGRLGTISERRFKIFFSFSDIMFTSLFSLYFLTP
nr:MAG TPA: hypothetical protein [Caudoviricetes sp.]